LVQGTPLSKVVFGLLSLMGGLMVVRALLGWKAAEGLLGFSFTTESIAFRLLVGLLLVAIGLERILKGRGWEANAKLLLSLLLVILISHLLVFFFGGLGGTSTHPYWAYAIWGGLTWPAAIGSTWVFSLGVIALVVYLLFLSWSDTDVGGVDLLSLVQGGARGIGLFLFFVFVLTLMVFVPAVGASIKGYAGALLLHLLMLSAGLGCLALSFLMMKYGKEVSLGGRRSLVSGVLSLWILCTFALMLYPLLSSRVLISRWESSSVSFLSGMILVLILACLISGALRGRDAAVNPGGMRALVVVVLALFLIVPVSFAVILGHPFLEPQSPVVSLNRFGSYDARVCLVARSVPREGTKLFSEILDIRGGRGEEPSGVVVKNERVDLGWFEGASQHVSWKRFNFSASFDLLNLSTGAYVVLVGLYEEPAEAGEGSTKLLDVCRVRLRIP